jgi:hypothetical protein
MHNYTITYRDGEKKTLPCSCFEEAALKAFMLFYDNSFGVKCEPVKIENERGDCWDRISLTISREYIKYNQYE